ncbi:hypothetical protein Pcinc_022252 [Petrolisthes cinctipes]|uniref:Uncharacterized protein n=1 Tax=Petrolisthes cinctipes TaxID=88211 RepID=A0AAE1FEH5_PETCI|nr:hypothetical protein Pcinc_022252 [Petrolisthes cinctipes]
MPRLKQAKEDGKIAFFRHTKLIIREKNEAGGVAEPVSRDGGVIEIATRQSLPASAGERLSAAAAARVGNGGGAAAVVDSDDGAAGAGIDGGAVAPVSVTGVAMSPAGGVPSPGRRYAAAASAGDRGVSGVGEGATQRQAKYLRSGRR